MAKGRHQGKRRHGLCGNRGGAQLGHQGRMGPAPQPPSRRCNGLCPGAERKWQACQYSSSSPYLWPSTRSRRWSGGGRGVPNLGSVAVINLLLGWTLAGWVVSLAMALRSVTTAGPLVQVVQNQQPQPPMPPPTGARPTAWPSPPPPGPEPLSGNPQRTDHAATPARSPGAAPTLNLPPRPVNDTDGGSLPSTAAEADD